MVDAPDDLLVDLADQHHLDDLDRLLVGYPHAPDEARLLAQALHERADLGAAAVHDDRIDPDQAQQDHVQREGLLEVRTLHRGAAILDDDRLTAELPDIRKRLQQYFGAPGICHRRASPLAAARLAIVTE